MVGDRRAIGPATFAQGLTSASIRLIVPDRHALGSCVMRILFCLLVLMASSPAGAQTRNAGWLEVGRANYPRTDYGGSGPIPRYFAPNSYAMFAAPGPHTYTYRNGVRVWYGSVPAFAPVVTSAPVLLSQAPAVAAPASPGPRVYRYPSGVRVWYGPGY